VGLGLEEADALESHIIYYAYSTAQLGAGMAKLFLVGERIAHYIPGIYFVTEFIQRANQATLKHILIASLRPFTHITAVTIYNRIHNRGRTSC